MKPSHDSGASASVALLAVLSAPAVTAHADGLSIRSAVLFSTRCAHCHEGECSGRMSLHLADHAADQHIRRHGGDLPQNTVQDLAELLRYTKERCAFYPIPLNLAQDGSWGGNTLDRVRDPDGTAYFLPLGRLESGAYRLWMDGVEPDVRVCAELIAADFDFVRHNGVTPDGERQGLRFQVEVPTEVFLRLRTQGPIVLTRVELIGPGSATSNDE